MPFTREQAQQYLEQHASDPVAALIALDTQRDEVQEGRDREGRAAQNARRERDTARSELDTAREELRTAQEAARTAQGAAVPQGATVLTGDDAAEWQSVQERGGLTAWDQDRTAAQSAVTARQEALVARLAAANNWNAERLQRLLNGRTLEEREQAGEGGQTLRVIGLVDGETFTDAVTDLRDFAPALAVTPTTPALPARPGFISQQPASGTAAPATDPIQARLQQKQEAAKTFYNPLSTKQ